MWRELVAAAVEVARRLQLPETWLNRDCTMYAWCLPLGWQSRCERVGTFGRLEVLRIARIDLIAGKVISSPKRPQDVEDLRDMRPTEEELGFVKEHIDRLEAEHLDGRKFDDQRVVLASLRGGS